MKKQCVNVSFIFSVCIFLISIIYLYEAKDLVLGTMKRPGVGFLPIVSGTLLAILSLVEMLTLYLRSIDGSSPDIDWKKIAIFFFGIVLYLFLLKPIGYIFTTFALLVFLTKLFGAKSWLKPLLFSIILSLGSYYLFAVVLQVQLP
ncbi:MAG: tripartite tricarboxylate transporter TctB family protein [Bacteroidota bacterium]